MPHGHVKKASNNGNWVKWNWSFAAYEGNEVLHGSA